MQGKKSAREALRDNVKALMQHYFKTTSVGRLMSETGIGASAAAAILNGSANARIDTLEKIAKRFRIGAWQLMLPEFSIEAPRLTEEQRLEVEQLRDGVANLSPAQRDFFLQNDLIRQIVTGPHYPVEKMGPGWDASGKKAKR